MIPELALEQTAAWLLARLGSSTGVYWYDGPHDPVVFLSAISQQIKGVSLGLFSSRLTDRPPLLASRQLMTLDHLVDGEIFVGVDDAAAFESIAEHLREDESGINLGHRPTLLG